MELLKFDATLASRSRLPWRYGGCGQARDLFDGRQTVVEGLETLFHLPKAGNFDGPFSLAVVISLAFGALQPRPRRR